MPDLQRRFAEKPSHGDASKASRHVTSRRFLEEPPYYDALVLERMSTLRRRLWSRLWVAA
jgi:hypothetical protein